MRETIHVKIAVVAFFPVVVAQANLDWPPPQPWTSGETTVTLSQDGTLTVSGEGAMDDTPNPKLITEEEDGTPTLRMKMGTPPPPWDTVRHRITGLVIEDGVTHIGDGAFTSCTDLRSITISNSVTSIGNEAFNGCTNLTSVTIPNSVTSIGEYAFANSGLMSAIIPNGMKTTGSFTFFYCTGLTSVTIPQSVNTIETGAFGYCTSLTSMTVQNPIPPKVESFNYDFFQNGLPKLLVEDWADLSDKQYRKYRRYIVVGNVDIDNVCLYVPLFSIPAYRSADGWKEFKCVKPIGPYGPWLALGILSVLLVPAAVFVVIRRKRKAGQK